MVLIDCIDRTALYFLNLYTKYQWHLTTDSVCFIFYVTANFNQLHDNFKGNFKPYVTECDSDFTTTEITLIFRVIISVTPVRMRCKTIRIAQTPFGQKHYANIAKLFLKSVSPRPHRFETREAIIFFWSTRVKRVQFCWRWWMRFKLDFLMLVHRWIR